MNLQTIGVALEIMAEMNFKTEAEYWDDQMRTLVESN